MNRLPLRQLSGLLVGLGIVSCSFSRFSDLKDDTPVLLMAVPSGFDDTGSTLAAIKVDKSTYLYAGAKVNFAFYSMGNDEDPAKDAVGRIGCRPSEACWIGHHVAGMVRSGKNDEKLGCFAYGINIDKDELSAVQVYCHNATYASMPVPTEVRDVVAAIKKNGKSLTLELAANRDGVNTTLLGALPNASLVWWYPSGSTSPRLWQNPFPSKKGVGSALAVLRTSDQPLAVVADTIADAAHGRLWVFRTPTSGPSETLGCISGGKDFGRVLAAGRFHGTKVDDLAVADAKSVFVLSQDAMLDALATSQFSEDGASADCATLQDLAGVIDTSCKTGDNWSDCAKGEFGASLAPADLNGDDTDELLVGVPGADVRGENAAGVVVVYRATSSKLTATNDDLFISSAESNDRLGQSVVGVPLSRPDVVVAGAPGGNKVATFFCSSLLEDEDRGTRCP
jgi:hypothetical protein